MKRVWLVALLLLVLPVGAFAQGPTVNLSPVSVGGKLALTVTASGPALGDIWVSLPSQAGAIGHKSWNGLVSSGSMYFSPSDLGNLGIGTYTLNVRVYDANGNFTDASTTFTVDGSSGDGTATGQEYKVGSGGGLGVADWQTAAQGFNSSFSPLLVALIPVFVVVLAIWLGPLLVRSILHRVTG